MRKHVLVSAALGMAFAAQPVIEAKAAAYAAQALVQERARLVEPIQLNGGHPHRYQGPHAYPGWRGQPGWRGAPVWRGPPGWSGRPYWYGRPWVRRPYYGTIIAGVALGTIITVAAVGYVPPRPAPNLCWYWADPYGNRGYWDYC
jgi:hypothetical protein